MVSFLPHLVIPGLVALAFFPASRRRILALAPLAWLPDLDYVIPSQHRAVTHSILIPLSLAAAVGVMWRLKDPEARPWEFATRPGHPVNLTLAAYFVASHLFLDVFAGGVVLFWPLLDTNFYTAFEIRLDTARNTFTPAAEAGTSDGAPALAPDYPWLTSEHAAIAAFLLACLAVGLLLRWTARRRAAAGPVVVERRATLAEPLHKR